MRFASVTDRLANLGADKWAVHREARRRVSQGRNIIELAIGEPDMPAPRALVDATVASLRSYRNRYALAQGETPVLEALAARYSRRSGRQVTTGNVIFMPGTQAALFAAMHVLAETGDEVLVGDPFYATYEGVIRAAGADMVLVPLHPGYNFHMRASDLEARITPRSRVLLLNSPHNPTGATLSGAEIAEIVAVCKRHDLWIVSDEVYETMAYGAPFASPFDNPEAADRTVVVSSISKSHMLPGYRAGWCVGPADFIARMLLLSENMLFSSPPFLQDAVNIAVSGHFAECRAMVSSFARRAAILPRALADVPGLACRAPEGGMFCMVDVSGTGIDGETFAWRLLEEESVAVMPGSSFGRQAAGHVRVSLSAEPDLLLEAASRIASLATRLSESANGALRSHVSRRVKV